MVSPNTANGTGRGKGTDKARSNTPPGLDLTHNPTATAFTDYNEADTQAANSGLVDVINSTDPDQLKAVLKNAGFELHTARKRKGAIPKQDKVPNRLRLNGYVPAEMRKDVQYATVLYNITLSDLVTEAVALWLEHRKFRRPGT